MLAVALLVAACTTSQPQEHPSTEGGPNSPIKVGDKLSATFIRADGTQFKTKDLAGKPYFLNFWATWCKPCIVEMPDLETASAELQGQEVRFILASDEPEARVNKFRQSHSYEHLEIVRLDGSVGSYGVMALPTSYLVDADGIVRKVYMGAQHWEKPEMIDEISKSVK